MDINEIDAKTISEIIKDAQKTYDDTAAVGQPYTVRHFENLEFVIKYLKRIQNKCLARDICQAGA